MLWCNKVKRCGELMLTKSHTTSIAMYRNLLSLSKSNELHIHGCYRNYLWSILAANVATRLTLLVAGVHAWRRDHMIYIATTSTTYLCIHVGANCMQLAIAGYIYWQVNKQNLNAPHRFTAGYSSYEAYSQLSSKINHNWNMHLAAQWIAI